MDKFEERTLGRKRVLDGRLLKVDEIDVELPDGRRAVREVVCHPGAACVLVRAGDGRYVFVKQFRKAADRVMLEIVAGTLEPGEDPDECARREVAEEARMTVTSLERLCSIYAAPGYTTEKLHIYLAEAGEGGGAHKPDADENIERVLLSAAEVDGMVDEGLIDDAKSLVAWLMLKRRSGA